MLKFRQSRAVVLPMDSGAFQVVMIERLIDALERARASSRSGDPVTLGDALAEALAALGGLYGTLDAPGHPEVSHQLSIVYDMCLRHIAMVHRGRPEMLDLSLGVLRPIHDAFLANADAKNVGQSDVSDIEDVVTPKKTTKAA